MDNKRIINYQKIAEASAAIIYDEKIKILEYEEILAEKKQEYKNIFLFKRLLSKDKKEYIDAINEHINISTNIMTITKKELELKKDELIKNCFDDYLNNNEKIMAKHECLKSVYNNQKLILEIVDSAEKSGRLAIEWICSAINETNELLTYDGFMSKYVDMFIPEINIKLTRAIGLIECFKKNIDYGSIQVKSINAFENISMWENVSKILKDDKSQFIKIMETRRQLQENIAEINTSLAILKISHNIINNESKRLVESYNLSSKNYNNLCNDINEIVKSKLEEVDIKI